MKIKKLELLAPAQNKDMAFCAINYGADSVYIGANAFGARKNAANSIEDIKETTEYAHKFGAKVYVTINTILDDKELDEAAKIIEKLHKIKADGVIFQDFGIPKLAAEGKLPDIKLIASTQCDIRDADKAKFFEKIGVKRAILARELSADEIKKICAATNIEIETFIHGALCVSYSGQCYLSYKIGGRSANRGECAQACRKKYTLEDETGKTIAKDKYILSLKDFMAANRLEELIDAGVTSFKIEGRLKDENYIKNTVGYYRKLLNKIIEKRADEGFRQASSGKVFFDFTPDVKKSFNRDFCEYFLNGKNPGKRDDICNFDTPNSKGEYIGTAEIVKKEYFTIEPVKAAAPAAIHPQDGLCYIAKNGELKGFLVNSVNKNRIYPNILKDSTLEIRTGAKIYRNKDIEFENLVKNSKTKRRICVDFRICDGYIEAVDEDKNIVRLEFDTSQTAKNPDIAEKSWISSLNKCGNSDFYVNSISFIKDGTSAKPYFLPTSKINELRRKAFEELIKLRLRQYIPEKQGNISAADFPSKTGNYRLNVHNKSAEEFYNNCNCKVVEKSLESGISTNNKELMRTKYCIRNELGLCLKAVSSDKNIAGNLFLIDEKGAKYRLCFDCKKCEMSVLSIVTK